VIQTAFGNQKFRSSFRFIWVFCVFSFCIVLSLYQLKLGNSWSSKEEQRKSSLNCSVHLFFHTNLAKNHAKTFWSKWSNFSNNTSLYKTSISSCVVTIAVDSELLWLGTLFLLKNQVEADCWSLARQNSNSEGKMLQNILRRWRRIQTIWWDWLLLHVGDTKAKK